MRVDGQGRRFIPWPWRLGGGCVPGPVRPPFQSISLITLSSGMTCWRRLAEWQEAGGWQRLHETLLAELRAADKLDWSKAVVDSSHLRAMKGGPKRARAPRAHHRVAGPQGHRTRLRARRAPLGRRANRRPAALVPSHAHPVGDPRRHPRSVHEHRLQHHLLPTTHLLVISLAVLIDAGWMARQAPWPANQRADREEPANPHAPSSTARRLQDRAAM